MRIDRRTVLHVAELARLDIDDEELAELICTMSEILDYVAKIEALDTSGIEPLSHVIETSSRFRADQEEGSVPQETALANSPQRRGGLFSVPRIIEQ